jgi:HEAT repeat protein
MDCETLIATLDNPDENIRDAAIQALAKLGDLRAVEPLKALLEQNKNSNVACLILRAISQLGQPVKPDILEMLQSPDVQVRKNAISILLFIKDHIEDEQLLAALLAAFKTEPDKSIRASLVFALARFQDKSAVEPLLPYLLSDSSSWVRMFIATAAGDLGSAIAITNLLLALEKDTAGEVRIEAGIALGKLKDKQATAPLIKAVLDQTFPERHFIAQALGQLGDLQAVPTLVQILENPAEDSELRNSAATALGDLGEANPTVISLLTSLLASRVEYEHEYLSVVSAVALSKLGAKGRVALLNAQTHSNDEYVRRAVTYALEKIKG